MHNELSSPTVEDTLIVDNLAWGMGGGVSNHDSSPALRDCTFIQNVADELGGGMTNWGGAPTLSNCTFWGNQAGPVGWGSGGGLYSYDSSPVITNSLFALNEAAVSGGGIFSHGGLPVVTNSSFHANTAGEEGGAIYNDSVDTLEVYNSILWGDLPEELSGAPVQVTYSDVQGGYPGEGNISDDPLWVDPGAGDYHLGGFSPCIDVGANDAPALPDYDYEGDDRIMDGDEDGTFFVDMGVDEVLGTLLEPITGLEATNDSPTPAVLR